MKISTEKDANLSKPGYRPEIDGLRAIAVMAVVLFHAEIVFNGRVLLEGGFIGVDVFFVISGYLITSILLNDLQRESFSFARFYERRARRILPALLFIMIAFVPVAWAYLLPQAMADFASSIVYSLGFVSNLWFFQQSGYFAEPALLQPFLHTWSLAIEEQFYLLYPFLLFLAWKYARKRLLQLAVVGFLLSLGLAQYSSNHFPDANFYFLHTRGWELLAGGILAKLELSRGRSRHARLNAIMPMLGAALLALSFVFFDSKVPHPSLYTLVPVAGTALIIWYSQRGERVTELLSSKPVVAIGLVSYSIYLWHFPIFAFARIAGVLETNSDKIGLIALSLALSAITYFLVERPARDRSRVSARRFIPAILLVVASLGTAQWLVVRSDGMPARIGPVAGVYTNLVDSDRTPYAPANPRLRIINIGDSHAGSLHHFLLQLAKKRNYSLVTKELAGCYPMRNVYVGVGHLGNDKECEPKNIERTLDWIDRQPPSLIIFSGRLPWYLSGGKEVDVWKSRRAGPGSFDRRFRFADGRLADLASITKALQATVREWVANGHEVVLMYPVPELTTDVRYEVRQQLAGIPAYEQMAAFKKLKVLLSLDSFRQRSANARKVLDQVPASRHVVKFDPAEVTCGFVKRKCSAIANDKLLYRDDNHLSLYGASLVLQRLVQEVKNLQK